MALLADTTVCPLWNKAWVLIVLSLMMASCQNNSLPEQERLPFYNSANFDAEWIAPGDSNYASIHTIDTFTLTNQSGETFSSQQLKGKIYIANFFFTSCMGICPQMTNNFKVLQKSLAAEENVKLVSFSVMPWVDSVSRLKDYGKLHEVNESKWYLLTGNKERIYDLARRSYFAEKGLGLQKDNSEFLHTETMLLIDKSGRIRGIYNATQKVDIGRVLEDVKVLLKES